MLLACEHGHISLFSLKRHFKNAAWVLMTSKGMVDSNDRNDRLPMRQAGVTQGVESAFLATGVGQTVAEKSVVRAQARGILPSLKLTKPSELRTALAENHFAARQI